MDAALKLLFAFLALLVGFFSLALTVGGLLLVSTASGSSSAGSPSPVVVPLVTPASPPVDQPKVPPPKRRAVLPWNAGDPFAAAQRPPNAVIGSGVTSPDGRETIQLDLQPELRLKNTGGMGPRGPGSGAGLCVFTSINHAAWLQNVRCLQDLQKKMMTEPGGGYPEKVDQYIKKICPDLVGRYSQLTDLRGTPDDMEVLRDVIASGRMLCITYDGTLDPHYGFRHIEHMVNVVHLTPEWACVLDNNYPSDKELVWMRPAALAWMLTAGHSRAGWAVVLHAPGRLPIPHSGGPK